MLHVPSISPNLLAVMLLVGCSGVQSSGPGACVASAAPAAAPHLLALAPAPPRSCEARDVGTIGDATLRLERCSSAPIAALTALRGDAVVATAPLDDELATGWEAFKTRFRAVPAGDAAMASLVLHGRQEGKDAWALLVVELSPRGLRQTAKIGPVPPGASLTHALEDLDGDGIPELRVGIAERFQGARKVETFALGAAGYDTPWSPRGRDTVHAVLCDGADRLIAKAAPDAGRVPCDPVIDFQRARVVNPERGSFLVASGPYAACEGRGCPITVLRERPGGDEVLLRAAGFVAVSPPGEPLAFAVRKAPGADAGAKRYCWKGSRFARCKGEATPTLAPWASLAPVRPQEP